MTPDVSPGAARCKLAWRFLHVFGPTTADRFASWSGISRRSAAGDRVGRLTTTVAPRDAGR